MAAFVAEDEYVLKLTGESGNKKRMIHCNPDQTDNRRWFFDSASLISTGPRARGCEEAVGRSALLGAFAAGTPKQSSKRNCRINDSLVQ